MRTSSDPQDPGFANFIPGKWEVYLDGRLVKQCVTADEEQGFVVLHSVDDYGHVIVCGGQVEKLVFHGRVKIREKLGWQNAPTS
jgi:hypothetical protein